MTVQMVLLPVFVQVGLTFFLLLWMATARTSACLLYTSDAADE